MAGSLFNYTVRIVLIYLQKCYFNPDYVYSELNPHGDWWWPNVGAGGEGAEDYACDIMTSKTHATVDTKVVIATAGLVVKNEWERDRERKRE